MKKKTLSKTKDKLKKKRINSNLKGKEGEREWSHFCRKQGYDEVRRSQQYSGKHDPDDADCIGLPYIHQEVKRRQKLYIHEAMAEAMAEANNHSIKVGRLLTPILAHRKNHKKWLVTMDADDWFRFYKYYLDFKKGLYHKKDKITIGNYMGKI